MKKTDVLRSVSDISQVDINDCEKVLNALESVLEKELESSQGVLNTFDKLHKIVNLFRKNK